MKKYLWYFMFLLLFVGCASSYTKLDQYKEIESKLQTRQFDQAIAQIESAKEKYYTEKEKVLYYLDLGMLYHYKGDYNKSNELLSEAERYIEELYTKSISKAGMSLILNDNALEYSGEDYEDIYINIFKCLNYLELNKVESAFVEIRRLNEKLEFLESKYKKMADEVKKDNKYEVPISEQYIKFYNSALGRYLSYLMYRFEGKYDDARIDKDKFNEAYKLQKAIYNFSAPKLESGKSGHVNVGLISFVGKSPIKKANVFRINGRGDHLVVYSTLDKTYRDPLPIPASKEFYTKLALPRIMERNTNIKTIKVFIGTNSFTLEKCEDLGNVAVKTFQLKEPIIYSKSISRALVKGFAGQASKKKLDDKSSDPLMGFLMKAAVDVAVDLSENADLRLSRFFPDECLIKDMTIAPGTYPVRIEYYNNVNSLVYTDNKGNMEFGKNRLNVIESFCLQ